MSTASSTAPDPYRIAKLYKHLRVADASDAMDYIGYFNIGRMSPDIQPLWRPVRFWGPAVTIRGVPAHRPMWPLKGKCNMVTPDSKLAAHAEWWNEVGHQPDMRKEIKPGCVFVMDAGGTGDVGHWGSSGSMTEMLMGVAGYVTNGTIRDTYEVTLHKTPMFCHDRGRTIDAGRMEVVEAQTRIGVGGAQVRPGDIVGADDDGVIVIPLEVAEEVARYARDWVLADMALRRERYIGLGLPLDETVDVDTVANYYRQLE